MTWRETMKPFRFIMISIGCLIGGPSLIARYFAALPPLESMEMVSGQVRFATDCRRSGRRSIDYPVMTFNGSPTRYKYMEWFPRAHDIAALVRPGEPVTIWTDRDGDQWVWRIEQGGVQITTYEEIRAAVKEHRRFDWMVGSVLILIGVGTGIVFVRRHFKQR